MKRQIKEVFQEGLMNARNVILGNMERGRIFLSNP